LLNTIAPKKTSVVSNRAANDTTFYSADEESMLAYFGVSTFSSYIL